MYILLFFLKKLILVDKVIIHIGYPKTGSTWFQNQFFPNIKNFQFVDKRQIKDNFILTNSLDFDPKVIRNKFSKPEKSLILSHELLVGGMIHTGGVNGIITKEFANRLYSVFPEAHIIIFIRNQVDHIASAYNQYIRDGGNFNINKYLYQNSFNALNKFFFFSFDFLLFDKIISFYKILFPKSHVHIFLYEEFKTSPQKFIESFCTQFNFEIDLFNLNFEPTNTSFRTYIKPIYKTANLLYRRAVIHKTNVFKFDKFHQTVRFRLDAWNQHKIFGPIETSQKILGNKNYQYIKDYYKQSNRNLIEQHGLDAIKKFDYPL